MSQNEILSQNLNSGPTETDEIKLHRDNFNAKLSEMFNKGQLYKIYKQEQYNENIKLIQSSKTGSKKESDKVYHLLRTYDVLTIDKSQLQHNL